jgi:DNA mismatch repair protein MutS
MTIIDDYVQSQQEFEIKYGEKTCLFMQVGDFFEVYSTTPNCPKIKNISNILDVVLSRKNKAIKEISNKNPYMLGFPIHNVTKFLTKLLDSGYTIPLIEQVTEAPNPRREVTKIFSAGTQINNIKTPDSNNLVSIWIDTEKCIITKKNIICIGISIIDISIGSNYIYNFYGNDYEKTLTDMYQIIDRFYPKEVLISYNKNTDTDTLIKAINLRINIDDRIIHFRVPDVINLKLSYQTELLEKIFINLSMLSIIEYLNLETKEYGLKSYTLLLNFVYEHNPLIIEKINTPEILTTTDNLLLHNNTLLQLNIIENKNIQINTKYKSLFHVINHTSTALGKRLLKYRLLNPIFNTTELTKRYNDIDTLLNSNNINEIEDILNNVNDIERLHRKIALKTLHPVEFVNSLDFSYTAINELLLLTHNIYYNNNTNDCNTNDSNIIITQELIDSFASYRDTYNNFFVMDEMVKYTLKNIKGSFFQRNIFPDVDAMQDEIQDIMNYFHTLEIELSDMIDYKSTFVKIEHNDRDGYFLCATNKRCDILKKKLGKHTEYEFKKKTANATRITSSSIKNNSNKLIALETKISSVVKEYYITILDNMYSKYSNLYYILADIISNIDTVKSNAKSSQLYNYCKPTIQSNTNNSFFNVNNLRHPIIERFDNNIEYVSNSMQLGINIENNVSNIENNVSNIENNVSNIEDATGILLYGLNFSGKSSYLRAVGLCIIMAQSGMYVPANSFVYNPYHTFFTRISGDDNLFQGQSSFTVEMNDLRTILQYSDINSIILADELCKGTEYSSSLSLVASSVISLAAKNSNFIFTTHINELSKMKRITKLNNIKHLHLHVDCYNDGTFIYDRKLRIGSGNDIYGIEVAKSIKLDSTVIDLAMDIRNEYLKLSSTIINPKTSTYNTNVFVDSCKICGITYKEVEPSTLDVHHLMQQKNANCHGLIGNFHKNEQHNLLVVCKPCHIKIHQYNDTGIGIKTGKRKQTSIGIQIESTEINTLTNNHISSTLLDNPTSSTLLDNPTSSTLLDNPTSSTLLDNPTSSTLLNNPTSSTLMDNPTSSTLLDNPTSSTLLDNPTSSTLLDNPTSSTLLDNHIIKKKKCKYSDNQLQKIYSMKNTTMTYKMIIHKLKTEYNISISTSTLSKYFNS